MQRPEAQRLLRLQRLEKVRAIAKQTAAREAAEAESTLAQLEALAARTGQMEADYAARSDHQDGGALRLLSGFRAGLAGVSAATRADAGKARRFADGKLTRLAEAERQRQAVEDRAKLQAEAIARGLELPALGGRKAIGTALE